MGRHGGRWLSLSAVLLASTGCATSLFGSGAYDSQACVEEALRRDPTTEEAALARTIMEEACKQGDPKACSVLGVAYELGAGGDVSPDRARAFYRHACSGGNQRACGNLARLELTTSQDPIVLAEARDLLITTCEQGEASACGFAGALANRGEDRNPEKTAELLAHACERGQPNACFDLAELRNAGRERPEVRDLELYVTACLAGVEKACRKLGPRPATIALARTTVP
jgi:uncharacterized protein